jgi:ABC-type Fe3+-siderophore transport system permease subunit
MKTQEIDRIWHWRITLFVGILLAFVLLLGVSFGPISLDFMKILRTLFGLDGGLQDEEKILFLQLRLPRVLLAALVGAALATSGAVYQTVFRNPLADPYLLGAAAGAGLGATLALTGGTQSFHAGSCRHFYDFRKSICRSCNAFVIRDRNWFICHCRADLFTTTQQRSFAPCLFMDFGTTNSG